MKKLYPHAFVVFSQIAAWHFVIDLKKNIKYARPWRGWLHLLSIVIYVYSGLPASSQALDTTHALVDVAVRSNGQTLSVLLIPGEFQSDQWYYSTSNLHFRMRELSGKQVPEMTLLRYQRPDPDNPHKYLEGATLQLAIDINPLDESAKKSLLRTAETAAKKWESEYHRDFLAKLKVAAATASPKQEQWKALYEDYPKARELYSVPRAAPTFDGLIERALGDGLDSWAVDGLEESMRLLKMSKPISVAPLPISTAQLTLYDGSGQAAQPVGPTRGAAPEYAAEKLNFTVELERSAADTSEALLTSRTGIFMILRREYEILSSPLANRIVIDYDKAWQHYRSNSSFVSQAVDFASYQSTDSAERDKKNISSRLERDIMKAFDANGKEVSLLSLDTKTLQALVGRINRAVLRDEWAPSKVNLDSRGSPVVEDRVLSVPTVRDAGPASKSKDQKPAVAVIELAPDATALSGTETLLPGYRYRERKSVTTQGFLSLAGYSESIQNQLVCDEKTPVWENAYFLLPGIGDDPQFGVRKVTVDISLNIHGKKWREQTATWTSRQGWILEGGKQPTNWGIVSFPLPEARDKYGDIELLQAEFHIDQEIMSLLGRRFYLKAEYEVKIFDGKSMIVSPLECIQPVIFDFSNLRWRSPELSVYSVEINVTQKLGRFPTLTHRRTAVPGRELLSLPLLLNPMLETDVGSVSAEIEFASKYYDAKAEAPVSITLPWYQNDKNLVDLYPALFISIFNGDWKN